MYNKTIVFILTGVSNPNSLKRIDEFYKRGFDVKAYGFDRGQHNRNKSEYVEIVGVGSFSNDSSYISRIKVIKQGIKHVINVTKDFHPIYYLIGLDVAILFRTYSKRAYIFEEADLVHTYFRNLLVRKFFESIDRYIIRKSLLSVFRSEGFPRFHFGNNIPENCRVIPNRLNKSILKIPIVTQKELDIKNIKIGFVGLIRFVSIYNFAKVIAEKFPQHEMHFYGIRASNNEGKLFHSLEKYSNIYFHGSFSNPADLPRIYSSIDLVLSTYDVKYENVRYAEPNKIYESMYFDTPIIVSSGTFLADKVERMGIGYTIDAMDDTCVTDFMNGLTKESISNKKHNISRVPKMELVNENSDFFVLLEKLLK